MTEVHDRSYEPIEGRIGDISKDTLNAMDKWRGIDVGVEATKHVVTLEAIVPESPDQEQ